MNYGYCTNLPDACENAKNREPLPIAGQDSVCPKCASRLMPIKGKSKVSNGSERNDLVKVVVAVALVALLGFGAWTYLRDREKPAANAKGPAINSPSPDDSSVILRLAGSNTIGEKLAPRLVMAWLESSGASDIVLEHRCRNGTLVVSKRDDHKEIAKLCGDAEYNPEKLVKAVLDGNRVAVDIRSHGSSSAYEALAAIERPADIGMSSRAIKPAEVESLKSLGDMTGQASEHVIGLDGIAVITHRNRSLDAISIQELRRLFTGEIEYWQGSTGSGQRVEVYARDDNSGTYDTFKSLVLSEGGKLVSSARRYEDSGALAAAVAADENAIGFVGLAYLTNGVRAIPVAASAKAAALAPTEFTIKKEDYALSRRLYFYTATRPSNDHVMSFVDFTTSHRGQKIVDESGFVDLIPFVPPPEEEDIPCVLSDEWSGGSDEYCALIAGKRKSSVSFRFRPDSDQLDNRALGDLRRLLILLEDESQGSSRIALVGFADSDGLYEENIELSRKRSAQVKRMLESLGISNASVHGFGEEISVGDNDSAAGKQKNRRVEVWLY